MSHVLDDAPLVLIESGFVHEDRMARMKIRLDDILENGRLDEGVERLDQIKHTVWERSGAIAIIAEEGEGEDEGEGSAGAVDALTRRPGKPPGKLLGATAVVERREDPDDDAVAQDPVEGIGNGRVLTYSWE